MLSLRYQSTPARPIVLTNFMRITLGVFTPQPDRIKGAFGRPGPCRTAPKTRPKTLPSPCEAEWSLPQARRRLSGPRTAEGLERCRQAPRKHGGRDARSRPLPALSAPAPRSPRGPAWHWRRRRPGLNIRVTGLPVLPSGLSRPSHFASGDTNVGSGPGSVTNGRRSLAHQHRHLY